MQRYQLAYGKDRLTFQISTDVKVGEIEAKPSTPIIDVEQAIREALAHPLGTPPLSEIIQARDNVVIVVSDHTRLWVRTDLIVPVLLDALNEVGVPDSDITIVTATGDHRPLTHEEHVSIVGEKVLQRVKMVDHDCHAADLVDYGFSSQGTPIKVNRLVAEADKVILTGGIAYHLLAGFGGGRKSIAPGVCGYETIQANHGLALKDAGDAGVNSNIQNGKMIGNPVSEDMLEIARTVGADFVINVVVNEKKEFVSIVSGELHQAHEAGCEVCKEIFGIEIEQKADLVVVSSGGYPKDIQLYQSIKALDNAAYAVKDGGVILLISECSDGVGSRPFHEFFSHGEVEEMNAALNADFMMPGFVALRSASICRNSPVVLISSVPDEVVKGVKMLPAHSPEEALEIAYQILGRTPETVYVMPHGGNTFPIVRQK